MAKAKEKVAKSANCTLESVLATGPLPVTIGGIVVGNVCPKQFSTGSFGFGLNGPVQIPLKDGGFADCQLGLNVTVKHSKPEAA
jgi:hypothetical protein